MSSTTMARELVTQLAANTVADARFIGGQVEFGHGRLQADKRAASLTQSPDHADRPRCWRQRCEQ